MEVVLKTIVWLTVIAIGAVTLKHYYPREFDLAMKIGRILVVASLAILGIAVLGALFTLMQQNSVAGIIVFSVVFVIGLKLYQRRLRKKDVVSKIVASDNKKQEENDLKGTVINVTVVNQNSQDEHVLNHAVVGNEGEKLN